MSRKGNEIWQGRSVGNKTLKIKTLKEIKAYTKNIKTESDGGRS
jgi:hypothetical protein